MFTNNLPHFFHLLWKHAMTPTYKPPFDDNMSYSITSYAQFKFTGTKVKKILPEWWLKELLSYLVF